MSFKQVVSDKIERGERLTRDDSLWLFQEADLLWLGEKADTVRKKRHPANRVTFVNDRNVNYTNICVSGCKFCAFYRDDGAKDSYLLDFDTIFEKVDELVERGGTQLLMQGGMHPDLKIEWFEHLLQELKNRFPTVQIHSLSPAEVVHVAELSGLSVVECLKRLNKAGLDSVPGGGAEILVDRVRSKISPNKIGWKKWAMVMEEAHKLGMRTTATMMFGSIEEPEDIVDHLLRVRDIQDKTGGFTAFISWSFQPANTELGGESATGTDYLRNLALSRLVLDNIENIQASWVTQGAMMAQVALRFGANDLGGTMLEENVVAAAGVDFRMSQEEIIELARSAGFIPAKRNTSYKVLEEF